jgi:hypothetical protein
VARSFAPVDLSDTQFRAVYLKGTLMRGVELVDVDIYGEIGNLTINGVDIGPLVNAELDRRYPDRTKMRPTGPAGFAEAWDVVEQLWGGTVDSWISRAILGDPSPWDPLDLPWDEMPDTPGVPRDRDVHPSLDVVLELRRDRMTTVRRVIDGLSEESLDGHMKAVWEHRLYAERDLDALEARSQPVVS